MQVRGRTSDKVYGIKVWYYWERQQGTHWEHGGEHKTLPTCLLHRCKENNFGQNIWDGSVVLFGASWGTFWELDVNINNKI